MREAERKLAEQAEASYVRMVRDWQAIGTEEAGSGRERDTGARIDQGPRRAKSRGRLASP